MPVAGEMRIGKIRPQSWTRDYWAGRLGIKLDKKCWDEIELEFAPRLDEWLQRTDWTPTERWILESQRNAAIKAGRLEGSAK